MQWMAPATGIAMCQNGSSVEVLRRLVLATSSPRRKVSITVIVGGQAKESANFVRLASGSGHESVSDEMSNFDPMWPRRLSPFGGPVWYDWPMKSTKPLVGKFRRLVLRSAIVFSGIIFATFTHAAEPYGPDPALSPEEVIQIQLQALQVNDIPTPNAGIRQAWILAHPDNRRVTGPLPRFERMINGAAYRPLLGHTAHDLERLATTNQQVMFKVTIETPEGEVLEYLWAVGQINNGPNKGAWMTTSVTPPRQTGRAI